MINIEVNALPVETVAAWEGTYFGPVHRETLQRRALNAADDAAAPLLG